MTVAGLAKRRFRPEKIVMMVINGEPWVIFDYYCNFLINI